MKNLFFTLLLLSCSIFGFSQNNQNGNWRLFPSDKNESGVLSNDTVNDSTAITWDTIKTITTAEKPGKVNITKDNRLDEVSKDLSTPDDGVSVKINGYRLQLVASSKKGAIDAERSKFIVLHNDVPTYMDYRQPNFRLRVGDFRTKLEAQKLQYELKDVFPSAIVVSDMIELPKIKEKTK